MSKPISEEKGKVDLFGHQAPETVDSMASLLAYQTTALKNNLIISVVHKYYPKLRQGDAIKLVESLIHTGELISKFDDDGIETYFLKDKLILTIFPKKIEIDEPVDQLYKVHSTFSWAEGSTIILNG